MIRHGWFGVYLVAVVSAIGCDRSPTPIKLPDNSSKSNARAAPTTQTLMEGPYRKVMLTPLPLSARVPESWDNKMPEGMHLNFLQGPAPDGLDVQVSLEVGSSLTNVQLKNVLQGVQRQADKDKQSVLKFQIRRLGDVQVMEEQRLAPGIDGSQSSIDWKLTFFVPRDLDDAIYVVEILGLNQQRFEKSKALLEKIFDSIEYTPS